jgi:hypothetical protein
LETGKEKLMNLKKFLCNLALSLMAFILTGLGTSMSIEGAIGISSFNALNYSLSNLFQMKIGIMTIILNLLFLFLYIVLTKGKFIVKYVFQLIAVSSIGIVINFFTYNIFDKMEVGNYFISVIYLVCGVFIGGISVAFILALDTMSFPVEAFCLEIANMKNIKFSKVRRLIDIISVSVSLLITLLFSYPLVIREGTVVSLLLFSTVIGYFHEKFVKIEAIRNLKIFI